MAVPGRVFVGLVVFGLASTIAVGTYTLLVLTGFEPPPSAPYEVLFPPESPYETGDKIMLVAATLFCMALTAFAWRMLLHGAREHAAQRRAGPASPPPPGGPSAPKREAPRGPPAAAPPERRDDRAPPPGYQ